MYPTAAFLLLNPAYTDGGKKEKCEDSRVFNYATSIMLCCRTMAGILNYSIYRNAQILHGKFVYCFCSAVFI